MMTAGGVRYGSAGWGADPDERLVIVHLTQGIIGTINCPAGSRDRLVFDDSVPGLGLRVTASGRRSWLFQFTVNGRKQRVPLGSADSVPLQAARLAAKRHAGAVASDRNPAAERRAQAAAARAKVKADRITLGVLVQTWSDEHLASRKPRYRAEAVRALRVGFDRMWDRPASELLRADVVKVVASLTKAGSATMARRLATYGSAAFGWARRHDLVEGSPFEALPVPAASASRDRVLTDAELAEVWRASEAAPFPYGPIVRMLILTGARRLEVGDARWSELDGATWTLPPARTKNSRRHVVPLSPRAQDIISTLPRRAVEQGDADLLFWGVKGVWQGWSKAKSLLDGRIAKRRAEIAEATSSEAEEMPAWTIHDIRRTVATGMQRICVRIEVIESALNHISGSRAGIVGVYQRHDYHEEKVAAFNAWADHLVKLVSSADREPKPASANVVIFPTARWK